MKILTCLLLLGLAPISASADSPPANTAASIRVACVGDSITEGVGADHGKSYPSQLQLLLGNGYQVKNFGLSGRTLLKSGDASYWKEQALKDAQDFQPNIVIIMLGTNDTKPQNWAHHDEFYGDYKEMIEIFKNLESKPHVFICRPPPAPDPGAYGITEGILQLEIPIINKLAEDEHVDLIDMHAALAGKPELEPDHVHPNTAGAGIMAQTAADSLTGKGAKAP